MDPPATERMTTNLAPLSHDWAVHHPLGAGSYIFRNSLIPAILRAAHLLPTDPDPAVQTTTTTKTKPLIVHAGYQQNNSPHIGTITVFALAFHLAHALRDAGGLDVSVHLDMVDTAPGSSARVEPG